MGRLSLTDIILNTVDKYTFLTKIVGSRWLDIDGQGLLFVFRTEQDKLEINENIKKKSQRAKHLGHMWPKQASSAKDFIVLLQDNLQNVDFVYSVLAFYSISP